MTYTSDAETSVEVAKIITLVELISPLLADHKPFTQGAAIAELLAMWLNGHVLDAADTEATKKMRETLLEGHIAFVKELIDE